MIKLILKRSKNIKRFGFRNYIINRALGVVTCLIVFLFLLTSSTWARAIWRIGIDKNGASEFGLPGSDPNLNNDIINYQVPQDWALKDMGDWKFFPCWLWPQDVQFSPKEIRITYNYPNEYRCPVLRIKAKSAVKNFTQTLVVIKAGDPNAINIRPALPSTFTLFEFPLGYIQKDLHDENTIIIKNQFNTDNKSIYFDYLELDDQDEDGDGCLDSEEIDEDADDDGIENKRDADTATFQIPGRDESEKKCVTLDIQEEEDPNIYFTGLNLVDTNSPDFPSGLSKSIFFPFAVFRASIHIPTDKTKIIIRIIYPENETLYDTAQFYLCKDSKGWQRAPIEIINENTIIVSIDINEKVDNDEDNYFIVDRKISIIGGLGYPRGVDIDLDEGKCFINSLIFFNYE